MRSRVLLVTPIVVACTEPRAMRDRPVASATDPVASSAEAGGRVPPLLHRNACVDDDDCALSCSDGAVSRAWYAANYPPKRDCQDGCASKGIGVRCLDRRCVATDHRHGDGGVLPACTLND